MTKKRLIDADKLEKLVVKHSAAYSHKDDILAAIAAQPTVDAVEVVRCKVCKYAVGHDGIRQTVLCQQRSAHPHRWDDMPFDGFCSCGERKK